MTTIRPGRRGRLLLPGLILLVAVALVWWHQHAVFDWFRLRGYEPSAAISTIATDTTMTEQGRHLFYINRPAVEEKAAFRERCPNAREHTVILGCYQPVQRGISVLRVDDPRLEGVEEVTAAHEMLHAAYDRLDDSERRRVDGLIADYASSGLQDTRLRETIATYEAAERPGEMHSIFGTEITDLPAELTRYYERYFADRGRVTALAANYTAAFTSRKAEVARYDAQLESLRTNIRQISSETATRRDQLEAARRRLDAQEASGDSAGYNQSVPAYNQQVQAYNARLNELRAATAQYNRLVEARNAVVLEEQVLQRELDSSFQPAS